MTHQVKSIFKLFYTFLHFVLILYLSLYPNQINKTMQNVSIFIQLFGGILYLAFIFNLIKLIFNQIKIR